LHREKTNTRAKAIKRADKRSTGRKAKVVRGEVRQEGRE